MKCCRPLYLLASLVCGYATGAPHFLGAWAALLGDQTPSVKILKTHTQEKKKWILLSCVYLKRVKRTIKSGCSPRRASCCSSARPPCVNKSSEADYKVAPGGSHGAIYSGGVVQPRGQTWKQAGHMMSRYHMYGGPTLTKHKTNPSTTQWLKVICNQTKSTKRYDKKQWRHYVVYTVYTLFECLHIQTILKVLFVWKRVIFEFRFGIVGQLGCHRLREWDSKIDFPTNNTFNDLIIQTQTCWFVL